MAKNIKAVDAEHKRDTAKLRKKLAMNVQIVKNQKEADTKEKSSFEKKLENNEKTLDKEHIENKSR